MSAPPILETSFLVLRRTPYAETSLIVAGLGPSHGQMHFLVRGARRTGPKQFPIVDLFRLLTVHYRMGRGELSTWRSADLVMDFGAVARNQNTIRTAGWLARFVLTNTHPSVPAPRLFRALATALRRLAACAAGTGVLPAGVTCDAAVVSCGLVFLDEHGLLPAYSEAPQRARHVQDLLAYAEDDAGTTYPDADTWNALRQWVIALLQYTDCLVPEGLGWPPSPAAGRP